MLTIPGPSSVRIEKTMFLHVIPRSALGNMSHGAYKDIISRMRWLEANVGDYRQVMVDDDDPAVAGQVLGNASLEGALVEYTFYPRIVRWLKQRCMKGIVAVRSINAEPLQHWDNYGWNPLRRLPWVLYGMGRLALKEVLCKCYADTILAINDWEKKFYWKWIPGRARVEWLPYVTPAHLIPSSPLSYSRRRVIACMPTSQKNRKSWDLVLRFIRLATAMKEAGADYDFVVTGNVESWGLPDSAAVRFTGFVDDVGEFLGQCRAVAMLSPLGYGFKTTIGDALAAGAHVLAHPVLIKRCPPVLRSNLLAVDTVAFDPGSCREALLGRVPAGDSLNHDLMRMNQKMMADLFADRLGRR